MPLSFDPQAALRYAQGISRPRLVGTAGETAVREELAAQLESFGCRVERERFYFWNAANYALYLQVLLAMILVALSLIHALSYHVASLGLLLLLAGFPVITKACEWLALFPNTHPDSIFTKVLQLAGLVHSAQNLVAVPNDQPASAAGKRLYFIAHYDSKSQPLPITVRAILFMVLLTAIAGFILFTLLASVYSFLTPALFPIGLIVIGAGAPQILNFPGNKSPGAIDNASAVGVVLHLAEILQKCPEMRSGLHITYLLTSAEEMYLLGASAHAIHHAAEFKQATAEGKLLFLNFDGIGIKGRLAYDGRGGKTPRGILARLTEEAAQAIGIRITPFRLVGALFDHIPFARRNLDAVTLLSIGKASRTIHTRRDTVSQLHPCGFEKTGNLTLEILRRWSNAGK
ncbi:MAG TPA: M28 family peptidase [Candidatus Hydrogenedentes bacterium]|nr:M28 family peptidase [Candidatus Hydrogenedentota bacterium]